MDYSGFSTINTQRFGQTFVGRVANPHDMILWQKAPARRQKVMCPPTQANLVTSMNHLLAGSLVLQLVGEASRFGSCMRNARHAAHHELGSSAAGGGRAPVRILVMRQSRPSCMASSWHRPMQLARLAAGTAGADLHHADRHHVGRGQQQTHVLPCCEVTLQQHAPHEHPDRASKPRG